MENKQCLCHEVESGMWSGSEGREEAGGESITYVTCFNLCLDKWTEY